MKIKMFHVMRNNDYSETKMLKAVKEAPPGITKYDLIKKRVIEY
jgi:hypothetical protein